MTPSRSNEWAAFRGGILRYGRPLLGALLLAAFAALSLGHLDYFSWSDDEAVFILTAQAVRQGARLYDEVWFNYPPGFIYLLRTALALGGSPLEAGRVAVLGCGLGGIVLVGLTARLLGGHWSGLLAMLLLATMPHYLMLSSAVMADVPAGALATGAVLASAVYLRRSTYRWLFLAGVFFGISLLVKPTTLGEAAVPLLAACLAKRETSRRVRGIAAFAVAGIATMGLGILLQNPLGLLHHSVTTYLRSRGAFELQVLTNARHVAEYVVHDKYALSHLGTLLLAVLGLWQLARRERKQAWLLGLWLGGTVLTTLLHTPLYRHHLVQLLFPLCALAGIGIEPLKAAPAGGRAARGRWVSLAPLALVAVELALAVRVDRGPLWEIEADRFEIAQQAVAWLQENTTPEEYVITDGHMLALRAGRPVPPELTNTSRMRIKTQQLTAQEAIALARGYAPAAIIFWENKLASLDDFVIWVEGHYDLAVAYSERHRIYARRAAQTASP